MRSLNKYIIEKLKISNETHLYNYFPKTRIELQKIIIDLIAKRGQEANLNDIDVSSITDMSKLFYDSIFNGDISNWDVSNVTDMTEMFKKADFSGNISNWDVSNVITMFGMFESSKFDKDISNWNINKTCNLQYMFFNCPLQNNPPEWYK